jgi:deazaflavin-dependent oxidoreductase (nitroreductase family)
LSRPPNDYNAKVIETFRANNGSVPGYTTLLLLHHIGAKSGEDRINPVAYLPDGDRYVVFATRGGSPINPAWYHNLKANPRASIELGDRTVSVLASEASGEERDRLYAAQIERSPAFGEYEHKTSRIIPVMILTPDN